MKDPPDKPSKYKLVLVWSTAPKKENLVSVRKQNMVWVLKEECPVCQTAGVWFDNWLDVNKCDVCGAVETARGWCAPPKHKPIFN